VTRRGRRGQVAARLGAGEACIADMHPEATGGLPASQGRPTAADAAPRRTCRPSAAAGEGADARRRGGAVLFVYPSDTVEVRNATRKQRDSEAT